MRSSAPLRLLVQSNLAPLHHHKGACSLCGGWRLSGGEFRRISWLLGLEVGVAPDDLDNVAEREDKGHAADEIAYEGDCRKRACDHAAGAKP